MMKGYKFLMPIILIAFFGLSIYMLYSGRAEEEEKYQELLQTARENKDKEIYVEAEKYYMQAIDMRESVDLHVEIAKFYLEKGEAREAYKQAEEIVKLYPEEPKAYEFIVSIYMAESNYSAIFATYDTMNELEVKSNEVDAIVKQLEYSYYIGRNYYTEVSTFGERACAVKGESMWGFCNVKGQTAISLQFESVGPFCDGYAPVVDYTGDAYYIDTAGNKRKVIDNIKGIVELGLLQGGVMSVYNGETWAFYKEDGTKISEDYDDASNMINGYAAVKKADKWYIIDINGKQLFDQSFDEVVMDERKFVCRNGVFFVKQEGKYYMINESGEKVTDTAYEEVDMFKGGDFAAVKYEGKWGFINSAGEFVIKPKYEEAKSYLNGYAAVKVNGMWGFITEDEHMVIEPQFEDAMYFTENGSVFVKSLGRWSMLCFYKYNH